MLIGGNNPVAIQSMAKFKTADTKRVIAQIHSLKDAGCDIVRVAVKDEADAYAIRDIKKNITLPVVADIHFNWRLAIASIESGADKIRLNPGNISKNEEIREICQSAKERGIPIRVGLNSGSIEGVKDRNLRGKSAVDRMVQAALAYTRLLQEYKISDIVISLKASSVVETIEAYRKIAGLCQYPLHLGVTATGSPFSGAIKSGIAIGALLLEGIGDTIRVSLTADPLEEIAAAKAILQAVERGSFGPEVISCPTCGRCEVDLVNIVSDLEKRLQTIHFRPSTRKPKVAVMGCVVNGPGEAKEALLGVAFGKKEGLFFKKGKPIRKVSAGQCADFLFREIKKEL